MSTELAQDPISCTVVVTNGAFALRDLTEAECSLSLK